MGTSWWLKEIKFAYTREAVLPVLSLHSYGPESLDTCLEVSIKLQRKHEHHNTMAADLLSEPKFTIKCPETYPKTPCKGLDVSEKRLKA